jgi:RNA polymerase sigma factor (TIGR02999 family)
MTINNQQVTQLLLACSQGNNEALADLMDVVYGELRRLALHYMGRERPNHTLQATALVHEVYLKLVDQNQVTWKNRAHFFGAAAQMMRRILIDHARGRHRAKRGGDAAIIPLDQVIGLAEAPNIDLLALDDALTVLAATDLQQSKIVELRFFGGLSIEETAEVLGISPATANREWTMAKARLYRHLKG